MNLITTTIEQLSQLFQANQTLWVFSAALLSTIVGSFLNVVISRLPSAMELECQYECRQYLDIEEPEETRNTQASTLYALLAHCPTCKTRLKPLHNIPVISYIFLKGRCAFCSTAISPIYPCVELLTAFLGGMVAYVLGASVGAAMGLLLAYCLIALTFIDAKHKMLPDSLTPPQYTESSRILCTMQCNCQGLLNLFTIYSRSNSLVKLAIASRIKLNLLRPDFSEK